MKRTFLLIAAAMLIAVGCNKFPTDSELPSNWDVDIYLPIIDEGYSVLDLLESDEGYFIDSISKKGVFSIVIDTFAQKTCAGELIEDVAQIEDYELTLPPVSGTVPLMLPFTNPEAKLDTAFFTNGNLRFYVNNQTDGKLDFKIEFPGAKRLNGKVFTVEFDVAQGEICDEIHHLENIAYSSRDYPNDNNKIKSVVTVDYGGSTGTYTTRFSLKKTKASFAKGVLIQSDPKQIGETLWMSLDSTIRRYSENITFLNPTFTILCDYYSNHHDNFEALIFDNDLAGLRTNSSEKVSLVEKANGKPFLDSVLIQGEVYEKVATAENTNVVDFIKFLPDSISLTSMVEVNPNSKYGTITDLDTLTISAILNLGNQIRIEALNHIDTIDMDISDDIRVLLEDALEVDFKFDFWNSMQLAAIAEVDFLNLEMDSLFTRQIVIDPSMTSNSADFRHTQSEITLVEDEIAMLRDSYYIRLSFDINTEGENGGMHLGTKDSLKVKSKFRVQYHLDTEE
jgi:hypothetical protein